MGTKGESQKRQNVFRHILVVKLNAWVTGQDLDMDWILPMGLVFDICALIAQSLHSSLRDIEYKAF